MPYLLIHHKVEDYATWKPAFDEHGTARRDAGSEGGYLFRSADDPNDLFIVLEMDDLDKAREFVQSDDLRQAMQNAGVAGPPDIHYLELAERPPA